MSSVRSYRDARFVALARLSVLAGATSAAGQDEEGSQETLGKVDVGVSCAPSVVQPAVRRRSERHYRRLLDGAASTSTRAAVAEARASIAGR